MDDYNEYTACKFRDMLASKPNIFLPHGKIGFSIGGVARRFLVSPPSMSASLTLTAVQALI